MMEAMAEMPENRAAYVAIREVRGMDESCKKMPVLRTLIPDACLEGITILTVCGAPEEMKGFIFDRLALEGQPPSEEFFNEVKKALIVVGAVRAFGFSRLAEDYLLEKR